MNCFFMSKTTGCYELNDSHVLQESKVYLPELIYFRTTRIVVGVESKFVSNETEQNMFKKQ